MSVRTYNTPKAFKDALERCLRNANTNLGRARQLVVFDRFLGRVMKVWNDRVVLKGGLVLEFRIDKARAFDELSLSTYGS